MDVKLLAVGLALAFGSYAIKVGLALAAAGRGRLYWVILLAYGFFFALAAILGQLVIRHLSTFQALLKGGLFLHLGVALGLFFWGISLWDRGPAVHVLMLPCPFCLLTTVLALALFSHLTGLLPWECGAFAYGIFGTMVLLASSRYLQMLTLLLQFLFAVHQKMGTSLVYRIIGAVMVVPACWLGAKWYGTAGAAAGSLLAATVCIALLCLGPGGCVHVVRRTRKLALRRRPDSTSDGQR